MYIINTELLERCSWTYAVLSLHQVGAFIFELAVGQMQFPAPGEPFISSDRERCSQSISDIQLFKKSH